MGLHLIWIHLMLEILLFLGKAVPQSINSVKEEVSPDISQWTLWYQVHVLVCHWLYLVDFNQGFLLRILILLNFRISWFKVETRLGQGEAELVFMENVSMMKFILISSILELVFSGRNTVNSMVYNTKLSNYCKDYK